MKTREFPASASQTRMLNLFGLTSDGTTEQAKAILSAAGLPANGIPAGLTPAAAKKLSDSELMAMCPTPITGRVAIETAEMRVELARAARNAEQLYWSHRNRERRATENQRLLAFQRGELVGRDTENILDDIAAASPLPADQAGQGLQEDGAE